ncbi:uncharacterized protein BX664DRAFT_332323 [Halteromyces radiatus]|uniref:uncharacterized protein n=1 Tax=Halteromyces radiatus TaxID=101107 RepID=UPI00222004B3|nr:uncharacterized protein BX664DRAFT_332323 [Halteromyces radiatus]KAI8089161.1 hypothetical protein BX664DRAFT_332323 [Halteromyces radiatus]
MPQGSTERKSTQRITRSQTLLASKSIDKGTTINNDDHQSSKRPRKRTRISTPKKTSKRSIQSKDTDNAEQEEQKQINTTLTTTISHSTPSSPTAQDFLDGLLNDNDTIIDKDQHDGNDKQDDDNSNNYNFSNSDVDNQDKHNDNNGTGSDQVVDVLDALLGLQHMEFLPVDTFPQDRAAAVEALRLNEQLQQLVKLQIDKVDKRIVENGVLLNETRNLSLREARIQRTRMEVHKPYSEKYDFFVDANGNTPFTEQDKRNTMEFERVRAWTSKERESLHAGIHSEVQRMIAYEHMAKQEPWRVWEVDKLRRKEWENYPVNKLDWVRISMIHVKTRNPMECMIQWTTQDHPKINKLPWKKKESTDLKLLVEKHGHNGKWEQIASELKTNRTAAQCFAHYQAELNMQDSKRRWTAEDDEALKDAVTMMGDKNWQRVALLVGGRTGQQCLQRWMKSINPAIRRSKWTAEEDAALRASVAVYGKGNWTGVQRHLPGRTDMQCRERWMNVLDPRLRHDELSPEEKEKLTQLVAQHGRKWSLFAELMPGRTDNILLRTWTRMVRENKALLEKHQTIPGKT